MKLAIMTKSTFFVEEDKILATLFEEGLDNLHLYKPDTSPIYSERLLSLLPEETYNKITVHSHFYLKEEYRLAGIHLDRTSEPIPVGYKGKISQSQSDPAAPTLNINELEYAAERGLIDKKVFAIGGINADNIQLVRELGFGGVVICDDLWSKFNIHNQMDYKELIAHFEKLRKIVY